MIKFELNALDEKNIFLGNFEAPNLPKQNDILSIWNPHFLIKMDYIVISSHYFYDNHNVLNKCVVKVRMI